MPLTVVVVDDDADYRMIIRFLLNGTPDGIRLVGEAADGNEGLALVRREEPDVLVTDLVMPGLNGAQLARQVREERPATKIILMSSYTDDAYRMMASDSGADVFIHKSVINSSLVPAIRDLTGRSLSGGSEPRPGGAGASSSASSPN